MSDFLTDDTNAILLLCGVFGKDQSAKPLTQKEYNVLVRWLIEEKMRPEDLLQEENTDAAAAGAGIDQARFKALLGRGVQLGFTVEEWQRSGVWVLSRSDKEYPGRYKRHLREKAPPLLFGVGDRSLLSGGGIAIVGSRNVDEKGEDFTRQAAELCAENWMPVVSGGARGVDQISMTVALESGGVTIGVLSDNLLRKSLERTARNAITDGRLLLISPYHPGARFTVGTAMGRNKLIYAMADYGLIVSAEYNKGGTWAGAIEELKRDNPLTVFVRTGDNVPSGNEKLLELGAIKWPEILDRKNLSQHLSGFTVERPEKEIVKNMDLFDLSEQKASKAGEPSGAIAASDDAVYDAVLPVIIERLENALNPAELAESLMVSKTTLNKWLKMAVADGYIRKLTRPVRYEKK